MKSWIKRFGMLAVLGTIVGSALVAGCSSPPEEAAPPANNAATEPADDAS